MINQNSCKIRLFSFSSALTVPVWSGESRDWSISKCGSDLVSGRAQEPGLLWLCEASHPHNHQPHSPSLVSLSVIENWFPLSIVQGPLSFVYVCVCVCQVCWSWACSSSCYWEQAHTPDGASAFPGHSVQSGSILRKTITTGQPVAQLSLLQIKPAGQVGSTPHHLQHFALMFSLDILAYLTPHMYRCNAQWLTDFRHCYHENFVFTAMALLFNSGNASKKILSA